MNINLTPSAIYKLLKSEWQITNDLKPVLQVIDIQKVYKIVLSDGSFHHPVMLSSKHYELVEYQQLQKGSIIQLNKCRCVRLCRRMDVVIMDLDVIHSEWDIIGNPKPYFRFDQVPFLRPKRPLIPKQECGSCCKALSKSEKRKGESSVLMEVEQLTSSIARMMMEKNKDDDDLNACIEKLEKLGRETKDMSISVPNVDDRSKSIISSDMEEEIRKILASMAKRSKKIMI